MTMTVKTFCEKHSMSRPTFYAEVKAGRLRVMKLAHATRVSDQAEADWIDACEQRAPEVMEALSERARETRGNKPTRGMRED